MKLKEGDKMRIIKIIICISSIILINNIIFSDTYPGPPPATRILVITDVQPVNAIIAELRNEANQICNPEAEYGYRHSGPINNVTVTSTFPASISKAQYDQVWDVRFNNNGSCANPTCSSTLTAAQQTVLRNFMAEGGTVFLMGENGGFPGRNDGIVQFVNSVIASGTFAASGIGVLNDGSGCCARLGPGAASAENFDSDYYNLANCSTDGRVWTEYPGGVRLSELATGRATYITTGVGAYWEPLNITETAAVGIGFTSADLKAPYNTSKLYVWFDWQTFRDNGTVCCSQNYANGHIVRNINDFLNTIPPPTPTPTNTPVPLLTKSANKTTANVGETITFSITYQNLSGMTANNVYIWDTIPTPYIGLVTILNGGTQNGNLIVWNVGNIANGASVTVRWVGVINGSPLNPFLEKEFLAYIENKKYLRKNL